MTGKSWSGEGRASAVLVSTFIPLFEWDTTTFILHPEDYGDPVQVFPSNVHVNVNDWGAS